jgi:hypothetical protein
MISALAKASDMTIAYTNWRALACSTSSRRTRAAVDFRVQVDSARWAQSRPCLINLKRMLGH